MPSRTSQITQVGKRQLELSNLSKDLFPGEHITKAKLIEYYFKIAPTILAHSKGRPLSMVRYPDGITSESFFQKDRPRWAPDWLEYVSLGEEKKDYILATEDASLVWLANLACIELHQMHCRAPHFDKPDYIVYDLDPPEEFQFKDLVPLAFQLKERLEEFGYHPFIKTTGRKGLHVLTPIEPKWEFHVCFEAAKDVAVPFVDELSTALTLQLKKEHRKGKVLLDIYRNRSSQTIVAPYSVRGLPGAPVSTPLSWEELSSVENPQAFDLNGLPQRIAETGDPWEGFAAYAAAIHTEKPTPAAPSASAPQPARTYKTPQQLESYSKKRAFDKSPEPPPAEVTGQGSAFVIHRHHATRLHYDLRLEQDGVLKSWAVPKGLPPRSGIKRLAVSVEDHPVEYVKFEGEIPKDEYGGGMMWKFAQGRYQISKRKEDGFYFRLNSKELNGEYRMHRTKDTQWLLERVDSPQQNWPLVQVDPMLARAATVPPDAKDYLFEVKWDGIRALITLDEGQVTVHGRHGLDITKQFPELLAAESFRATSAVFDGEMVCLESDGRPNFRNVIYRMQQNAEGSITRAQAKFPAVCYLFDCLYLDGRPILNEPLHRRREWLASAIRKDSSYRLSEAMEDGKGLFAAIKEMGLEGVMAKHRESTYQVGKRSDSWLKIKSRQTIECIIIGYTEGKNDRSSTFGALHLAQLEAPRTVVGSTHCADQSKELKYIGKAGTGFDDQMLKIVFDELQALPKIRKPIKEKPVDSARSVWVEPKLVCEVSYGSLSPDGLLREPVFLRLRPDLTVNFES